jgi:hypothetical protein
MAPAAKDDAAGEELVVPAIVVASWDALESYSNGKPDYQALSSVDRKRTVHFNPWASQLPAPQGMGI